MALVPLKSTIAAASLATSALIAQTAPVTDPFEFLRPTVVLSAADRGLLDAGEAIVRVVSGQGRELVILSAARINVGGDRLVAWVRQIADLKKGSYVPEIGRFSQPPRLEDLSALTLDDEDLESIRRCRIGACGVKLSDPEITELGQHVARAGLSWQGAVQEAFRRIVLARAQVYLARGHVGTPPYHDQKTTISPDTEFTQILEHSAFLAQRVPDLAVHLRQFPRAPAPDVESFLYWSKEALGGKPIIAVTHVNIIRPSDRSLPEALVAATQVFATHYMTGSLAVTAITRGAAGSPPYLTYLNRSRLDVLGGLFGGIVRRIAERRLRGEAAEVVQGVRRRLESGDPPAR